jgi:hypothetical protein
MSNLNDFLSRIQTDHNFYSQFRENPEEALASYQLSAEERAAVTESREQLWERLGQLNSYWKTNCGHSLLGSGESEFNVAVTLARPEVQVKIDEIRQATMDSDWQKPVLSLLEQIG